MRFNSLKFIAVAASLFAFGASVTTASTSGSHAGGQPAVIVTTQDTVSFSNHVMPIIERTCQQCHGGVGPDGEIVVEEGLDMTSYEKLMAGSLYGTVVEPGDPDGSYLLELILSGDMPKEGDALTQEEIQLISQWIAAGAENN